MYEATDFLDKVVIEPEGDYKVVTAEKKPKMSLLPLSSLVGAVRVFQYGARKYAPGNWRLATLADGAIERYVSAVLRHLNLMQLPNGLYTAESIAALDDESNLPHIDHIIDSLIMLRGILIKEGVLKEDPGLGNEPPPR